jgi:leukotriene-A4 hydrolase
MAPVRDPNTLSNYDQWRTKHTTANFTVDFNAKRLRGSVVLELESQTEKASNEIVLDSSHLDISSIRLNSAPSQWEVKARSGPNGSPVYISVPHGAAKGEVVKLEIELATTDRCTALQWLTPAQTSNKKAPFMFSQCQAIHARSIFPCQDTPDVKSTYDFIIRSPHVVVASGVPVPDATEDVDGDKVYKFQQKVPIPSYLFALASGDIASAPIGRCSSVATGPNELKASQWELQDDMDKFLDAAEKLVFPYQWGEYNVLVLPPSFPYGGGFSPSGLAVLSCQLERLTWPQAWRTPSSHLPRPPLSAVTDKTSMSLLTNSPTAGAATWSRVAVGSICKPSFLSFLLPGHSR